MFEFYACVYFVYSYKAYFSRVQFSVFTLSFSQTKLCISKRKSLFILHSNISITLKQISIFQTSNLTTRTDYTCVTLSQFLPNLSALRSDFDVLLKRIWCCHIRITYFSLVLSILCESMLSCHKVVLVFANSP